MTAQEQEQEQKAYEGIRAHFSKPQTRYGWNEVDKKCEYRVGRRRDGARCGVGCLIPDEKYKPYWDTPEKEPEGSEIWQEVLEAIGIARHSNCDAFLQDVQNLHDGCATRGKPKKYFITELDELAVEIYGLSVPS